MYLNGKKIFATLNNNRTLPIVVGGGGVQQYDEYDILLTQDTGLTVKFLCNSIIDWGDGSSVSGNTHTYSSYGAYTIQANGELFGNDGVFTNENDEPISILKEVRFVNPRLCDDCFAHQANLERVTFSGSETSIPSYAFYACQSLTSIILPSGITSIGEGAFLSSGISGIVIPIGVTSIGARAFSSCVGLSSITIPSGVERIEERLFNDCYHLSEIYLPNTINYIGGYAFFELNQFDDEHCDLYYNGTTTQWGNIEKAYRWDSTGRTNITVHCTDGDINI